MFLARLLQWQILRVLIFLSLEESVSFFFFKFLHFLILGRFFGAMVRIKNFYFHSIFYIIIKIFKVSSFGFKIPTQIGPKVLAQARDICKEVNTVTKFSLKLNI